MVELIKKLNNFGKAYYRVADMEKIFGLSRGSLYVTLNRLVKAGVLIRLGKNLYLPFNETIDIEKIANEIYFPCYLSFEKVLSIHGILSQIPYTWTFVTTRPSKTIILGTVEIKYYRLPEKLFFGFTMENGKNVAEQEKALLDQLYLFLHHKGSLNFEELDLKGLDKSKFYSYAEKFPVRVRRLLTNFKKSF